MNSIRLAIFASGQGTNAVSIIENSSSPLKVEILLCDQSQAPVVKKAQSLGIKTYVVEKTASKTLHEQEILKILKHHRIDWICLAGYMRLLSENFLKEFSAHHEGRGQIVNIHPSLLPQYPGLDSIDRAYQEGVIESGATLHYVDAGVDTGAIISQGKVRLEPQHTLADFKSSVHKAEYQLYKNFLNDLASNRIETFFYKDI